MRLHLVHSPLSVQDTIYKIYSQSNKGICVRQVSSEEEEDNIYTDINVISTLYMLSNMIIVQSNGIGTK
jgi:hypothetical protein